MALAIDASTPALASANAGGTCTTASFTPPAGAVLCAIGWADTASGNTTNTSQISDSVGGTTGWTIQATRNKADSGGQNGHVQVSTKVATGAAVTVTMTASSTGITGATGVYVLVMTGCDTTTPIDVIAEGSNAAGAVSLALPATITDLAWGFVVNGDWNVAAAPTAGANQTAIVSGGIGAGPDNRIYLGRQNATTTPAGTVITMSTATPTSANTNNYIGWALRSAATGTSNPIPPPPARRRTQPALRLLPGEARTTQGPTPTQQATPDVMQSRRPRIQAVRRARGCSPPWPVVAQTPPVWVPQQRRERVPLAYVRRDGRTWQPPWVGAAAAAPPARVQPPVRHRTLLIVSRRDRGTNPPTVPPLAPLALHRERATLPPLRTRRSVRLIPAPVAQVAPAWVPQPHRRRLTLMAVRHSHAWAPPWPYTATPVATAPGSLSLSTGGSALTTGIRHPALAAGVRADSLISSVHGGGGG